MYKEEIYNSWRRELGKEVRLRKLILRLEYYYIEYVASVQDKTVTVYYTDVKTNETKSYVFKYMLPSGEYLNVAEELVYLLAEEDLGNIEVHKSKTNVADSMEGDGHAILDKLYKKEKLCL